uniref:Uncharacterized protein n=1 Tax=Trichogramma kaykai TaxID=54128 RepID=A0ABD2WTF1_9HYME
MYIPSSTISLAQQKPSRLSALVSFLAVREDFLDTNARLGRHRFVSRARGPTFFIIHHGISNLSSVSFLDFSPGS